MEFYATYRFTKVGLLVSISIVMKMGECGGQHTHSTLNTACESGV